LIDDKDDPVSGDTRWCADSNDDGFGDPESMVFACGKPLGYVAEYSDCDDTDPEIGGGCDYIMIDGFEAVP
jgi:hypothetical protein